MKYIKYAYVITFAIVTILMVLFTTACVGSKQLTVETSHKVPKYRKFETFKNDTSAYLTYNFKEREDKYIGKKLRAVIEDMEIKPLDFIPNKSSLHVDAAFGGAFLIRRGNDSKYIYISWMPERLSYKKLKDIEIKYNYNWSDELNKEIENQIVTKIVVY